MRTIRVLLVDDSPLYLAVARAILAGEPNIEVAGSALSGSEALKLIATLHPDLVLLDLFMPEMNGLETTQRIKAEPDAPRVVIVTMDDDDAFRIAAAEHGADGFVAKTALPMELPPLIQSWYGECLIDQQI